MKKIFDFLKRENNDPLINILTRTSGRPNGFKKCRASILNQTYKNVRHIVSYDTEKDLDYIENTLENIIKVNSLEFNNSDISEKPKNQIFSPHNLYCNELLNKVGNGWVMFLDDDDMFINEHALESIVGYINSFKRKDILFIWQMRYPNGKLLPPKASYKEQRIELYKIGSPCFMIHSKFANKAKWDAWKCSDYRYIKQLEKKVSKIIWIEEPFIQLNNNGDLGRRNDL